MYQYVCLSIFQAISSSKTFSQGTTKTWKGLKYVREHVLTEACGIREESEKVVVLITDGQVGSCKILFCII